MMPAGSLFSCVLVLFWLTSTVPIHHCLAMSWQKSHIIYFSIINKPWHPLQTHFSSRGGDCQDFFFPEMILVQIFSCPVINITDTSLQSLTICSWAIQELQLKMKPSYATLHQKKGRESTECHFASFCHSNSLWWHPLSKVPSTADNVHFLFVTLRLIFALLREKFTAHSKNNLHNPQGVTSRPSVMPQDWFCASCPVTCAINFSSKVKLCPCCLHMSCISNSFDTNGSTLQASCAGEVCFLWNRVCVVFSFVPQSPPAIIYHTAVFF